MARNALDKMKKQGSAKAKQNRTERRTESAKQYNRSQNSSDRAYIEGNYKKVASNKAYGYRQGLKKGEIVKGEDTDWLRDDKIYRNTKVKENTSWKNPTNNNGKQKYAILNSHKWDKAKKFDDHLNTKVWDGVKTAKANQRKGKHISNAFEYGKGLLKDIIVDPAVDTMKSLGVIGSYGLAGLSGIAEDSGNLVKAISDPKRTYKDYSQGRSIFKENLKTNKEALDRTGFGESMATFLHDAKKRGEEETIRLLKEDGRGNEVKSYKEQIEKNKKRDTNLLNATGFAMELIAPTVVEDKVVDVVKGLGKNTVKSFKELKNGTASLATGILPEETAKLMSNSKKYAGKGKTGASDDVFYSGTKGNTSIDRKLDNEFNKTVNRVKDVVKQNPKTKNIGNFLDTLDEKPLKGTQRNIDGRTLNKKYTQTKDGYKPQLMREVSEVDNIPNGNVNGQYSMFGKDGNMDAYINNIQNPYARYERVVNKYGDDVEGLIGKIDSMSPHNADATLDYLRKTRPELYEQVVKGSDEIDEIIESTTRRKGYETQQKLKDDDRYFNTKDVNTTPKSSPEELFQKQLIKENNYKLLKETFNPKFVDNIGNISEREGLFRAGVKKFAENVSTLTDGGLEEASVQIKNIKYLIDKGKVTTHEVSSMLNDLFFDGKDVIRKNVSPRHANQLLDYVDDMIVKQANGVLEEYDAMGNIIPVGEGARKISASLTDYRYDEKMSNLASHFGVKNKAELTNRYKELQVKKKIQPLNTEEFYEYKELGDKIAKWDDEYKKVKYMSDEYDEYAKKAYGKSDGLEGYNKALDELAEKQARIDATKGRENILKEAQRNLELGSDPYAKSAKGVQSTASPRAQNMLHNGDVSEFNHINQSNVGGNIKNQIKPKDKIEYGKSIGLKYVNSKYGVQIPKDKQTFKNVYSNKNVKSAVDNLLILMNKEVKLTQSGKYGDEYAKIRLLVQDNIKYLDNLGVDRSVYFNELKNQKLKLIQTIQQDMQVGINLKGIKPASGKVKNTTKGMNPLEMAHIKINGNMVDNIDELTPDQLQWKYLMTEGAKTIDELFDAMPGSIPQRGDNLGNEIANSLRPNKTNTPLDKIDNNTRVGEQANIFNMFDDKDFQPNEDYVHLPDLLKEQNNFPVNGDFDVLDLLKPNVDKDSQIDMLGYITGQKIDVDKKSLYKSKKKRKFNTVDELDDTSFSLPKIPNQLDSGSFKQFADKLYELGINPYQKPPKTKPNNMPNEVYEYWNEFSNKVLSDDVSKKGINELKKIDEHIAKNSKELAKPTKTMPDKSLENLNIYEDSMKNSTKTIHKNIDEYNKLNKHVDDVNIDNYMGAINKMNNEGVPTFEQFKETVSKNSNGKLPYKDNEIYDIYKRWLNSWKKGLTVYNPGWHVQNFFQNKGQNYLAFGADALLPQTDAKNILKQINGKKAKDVNIFDKKNMKSYSSDEISKLAQELGVIDSLGEDIKNARGIFPRLEQKVDNSPLMKWLGQNEQTARLNHFIKQIERGMSPEDASKSVNKYLFDYSKKNGVDDFVGDFIDPFWTFHKNNAKLMYNSMYEHPSKINAIVRSTNGLETGIPEEQRQNEEYKYGKIQKPYANLTDSVNKDQYNYLYKQNMFPDVEDALPFEDEALENKMNPILRMLIQQSRGEGNFGNKIVDVEEGEKPGWNEITKEQRMKEVIMDLNPFMPNLVKTLDSEKNRQQKADDEKQSQEITDKQILMDWINYITGNKGNWYRNVNFK